MPRAPRLEAVAPTDSPSNRRESPPKNRDTALGVDRLSVSFPCRNFEKDPAGWSSIGTRNPGTPTAAETRSGFVPIAQGHQAFVGVQEIGTGATWAKVEFNPS